MIDLPDTSPHLSITTRMDRNELPYSPSLPVARAAESMIRRGHQYPSYDAMPLRRALAGRLGVEPACIVAASGSITVIQQAMLVAQPGELIISTPGFDAFPPLGAALNLKVVSTGVRADGSANLAEMRARVNRATRMIIICTPHSPTGGILEHRELAGFLAALPKHVLVLIDEAYGEFVDESESARAVELARADPRVIVTRTFSKAYGLAGLRVGYGVARPELAEQLRDVGVPYSVSSAAEEAALEALNQPAQLRSNVRRVICARAELATGLRELGIDVREGHGNFVWLPMSGDAAPRMASCLAEAGVLVKPYGGYGLRISVGTQVQIRHALATCAARVREPELA